MAVSPIVEYLNRLLGVKNTVVRKENPTFEAYNAFTSRYEGELASAFRSINSRVATLLKGSKVYDPLSIPIRNVDAPSRAVLYGEVAQSVGLDPLGMFGPDGLGLPVRWFSEKQEVTDLIGKNTGLLFDNAGALNRPIGLYQIPLEEIMQQHGRIRPIDVLLGTTYISVDGEALRTEQMRLSKYGRKLSDAQETVKTSFGMMKTNPIKYSRLEEIAEQMTRLMQGKGFFDKGQNVLVWDLETAGFSIESGIWQGTAAVTDETGRTVAGQEFTWNFKSAGGQQGVVRGGALSKRMAEGVIEPDDPVEVIKRFLDLGHQTEFRMAGQNIWFDIQQMRPLIQKHLGRITGEDADRYRQLAAQFEEAVRTPGKIVDTSLIARMLLGSQSGLETQLMTSNIIKVLRQRTGMSEDEVLRLVGQLHYSNVDVSLEQLVYGMMNAVGTGSDEAFQAGAQLSPGFFSRVQAAIEENAVLATHAKMRQRSMIHESLLSKIDNIYALDFRSETPDFNSGVFRQVFDSTDSRMGMGISPFEQTNLLTRGEVGTLEGPLNLRAVSEQAENLANFFNSYFGMEANNYTSKGVRSFRPDAGVYDGMVRDIVGDYQQTIAGLHTSAPILTSLGEGESLVTRSLSAGFGGIDYLGMGSSKIGALLQENVALRRMLGVSGFREQTLHTYNIAGGKQKAAAVPLSVIQEAYGKAGIALPETLTLETPGQEGIALMHRFRDPETEVNALVNYLRNPENLESLSKRLTPDKRGGTAAERVEAVAKVLEDSLRGEGGNRLVRTHGVQVHYSRNAPVRKALNYLLNKHPGTGIAQQTQAVVTIGRQTAQVLGATDDSGLLPMADGNKNIIISSAQIAMDEGADAELSLAARGVAEDAQTAQFLTSLRQSVDEASDTEFAHVLAKGKTIRRKTTRTLIDDVVPPLDEIPKARATGVFNDVLKSLFQTEEDITSDNVRGLFDVAFKSRVTDNIDFVKYQLMGHRKLAAGTAVAALAGYYLYRKEKKRGPYDETIEPMDYESPNTRYNQSQEIDALTNPYRYGLQISNSAKMNPLVTSGIMHNLDGRKVNHYNMGPNKNKHLFYTG